MKQLKLLVPILALAALIACVGRTAYNSLAATGAAEQQSFENYLTLVVTGVLTTNDVPTVAASHVAFRAMFQAAVDAAQGQTNTTATPPAVSAAALSVNSAIAKAKTPTK